MSRAQPVTEALKVEGVTDAGFEVYATSNDASGDDGRVVRHTRSISPTFESRADACTYLEKLCGERGAALPDNARVILWRGGELDK